MNAVRFVAGSALVLVERHAVPTRIRPRVMRRPQRQPHLQAATRGGSRSAGAGDVSSWVESDSTSDSAIATTRARARGSRRRDRALHERMRERREIAGCRALRLDVEANPASRCSQCGRATVRPSIPVVPPRGGLRDCPARVHRSQRADLGSEAQRAGRSVDHASAGQSVSRRACRGVLQRQQGSRARRILEAQRWLRLSARSPASASRMSASAVPGAKWAGNYPGAQFRAFASNASRRWFTTTDDGRESHRLVRCSRQARADGAADDGGRAGEAHGRDDAALSETPEEDNTAKMMEVMTGRERRANGSRLSATWRGSVRSGTSWSARPGDAIFRDEVLKVTSIVAPRPAEPGDLTPDLEAAREEVGMQAIFRCCECSAETDAASCSRWL